MFTVPSSAAAMPLPQFPANGASPSHAAPPMNSIVPLRRRRQSTVRASVAAAFPEAIPARRMLSLYEILKVEPTASLGEIKAAYRSQAKIHHPDRARSDDDGGRNFMEIRHAYETLSDPAARALYDLSLGHRRPRPVGYYPTRRWETDQCW